MSRARFAQITTSLLGAGLLATCALGSQPAVSSHGKVTDGSTSAQRASAFVPPSPTNAGKIFRWGNKQWGDEFKTALSTTWQVNQVGMVRNQHGMLTLDAPVASTDVTATYTGHSRRYGRWEARVRGRQYGTGGEPYTLFWELVPTAKDTTCGARDIVLSQYTLGTYRASVHVRNLPDADFTMSRWMYLNDNEFHTYAVEVTPDHVSWFVDTRVIRTERRTAALSGVAFTPRFRLAGVPGATMNKGRMQMDWMRYYTLDRANAKPITAPALTPSTYDAAC